MAHLNYTPPPPTLRDMYNPFGHRWGSWVEAAKVLGVPAVARATQIACNDFWPSVPGRVARAGCRELWWPSCHQLFIFNSVSKLRCLLFIVCKLARPGQRLRHQNFQRSVMAMVARCHRQQTCTQARLYIFRESAREKNGSNEFCIPLCRRTMPGHHVLNKKHWR